MSRPCRLLDQRQARFLGLRASGCRSGRDCGRHASGGDLASQHHLRRQLLVALGDLSAIMTELAHYARAAPFPPAAAILGERLLAAAAGEARP
jgi:hypothetical protein